MSKKRNIVLFSAAAGLALAFAAGASAQQNGAAAENRTMLRFLDKGFPRFPI